jgi:glycogen synthase
LKARLSYWLTSGIVKRQLLQILQRHCIDVLHVQCVSANAHYAMEARQALGLPLVVTMQGELTMDATRVFERSKLARETLRRVMQEAEIVTGCSRQTLRDAEIFTGIDTKDRGRAIFNAARTEDFSTASVFEHPRPYLFALGRLVPQKGFDILLLALAQSDCHHDLLLAGEGPELENLRALSASLGLAGRVHFVGRADRAMVARYFRGCAFFVLPSTADEGLPVVCAEAMSAGKAVVATASGGTPEAILHERNGLIVPKGDTGALADMLTRMTSDHAFRERAEAESTQRAGLFRWSAVTADYEQCYQDAMAARGLPMSASQTAAMPELV